MLVSQGTHSKRIRLNGKNYQIVWDTNSVAAPEGCLVIAVNLDKPLGQREMLRKAGNEEDLNALQGEAEDLIKADAS